MLSKVTNERGSAVVNFIFGALALLAIFITAFGIIANLYLRTVLTDAATNAARMLALADVSQGCSSGQNTGLSSEQTAALEQARQTIRSRLGDKLVTQIDANTELTDGLCTAQVNVSANFADLPLVKFFTEFEANARATLELQ